MNIFFCQAWERASAAEGAPKNIYEINCETLPTYCNYLQLKGLAIRETSVKIFNDFTFNQEIYEIFNGQFA